MIEELSKKVEGKNVKIAIIGLGYVGLPLSLVLSKAGFSVVGFDINSKRVEELKKGIDKTLEADEEELKDTNAVFTDDEKELSECEIHIITVPTPVDEHTIPNLGPVKGAAETIGRNFKSGKLVVLESTVYPGVTEETVVKKIEEISGKVYGKDFVAGYSPERINPGDKEHTLKTVTKVVSGSDEKTAEIMKSLYSNVSDNVFSAKNIKVAESAKVIENIQRDINIALINELTVLFDKIDVSIWDVLEAAETKWNFLRFRPGLVGGHCIPVDPYYLVYKAQQLGYHAQIITSGRRVNDGMASYAASRLIKEINKNGTAASKCSGVVFGLTFKEDVPDMRNSLMKNVIKELKEYGVDVYAHDPYVGKEDAEGIFGAKPMEENKKYDFVLVGIAHKDFKSLKADYFSGILKNDGVIFDIKNIYNEKDFTEKGIKYLKF